MEVSQGKKDKNSPVYENTLMYYKNFVEVKTPTTTAPIQTIFRNYTKTPVRQKRNSKFKKEECKALKISSLTAEYIANSASVATTVVASAGIFGSIGAAVSGSVSIGAYTDKYISGKDYIEKECDDIPFDEIKEILNKRFDQVDSDLEKQYVAIKENLKAIHLNYQAIKHVEDKVEKNLVAIQSGFVKLSDQLREAKTEEVTSKLITFIELFAAKRSALKYLPPQELINELEEENGILYHLQKSKMPQLENSLYEILNDVINRELAIPKSASDEIAIATLYLLYLGTQTYISITSLLLNGYNYLIHYNSQEGNTEACNKYYSLSLRMLKDYTIFLNGVEGRDGLIDKVIAVFNKVRVLDFIIHEKSEIVEFVSKNIQSLIQTKSNLLSMNDLLNKKSNEQIRYKFTDSSIRTPFLLWQDRRKVSYAIQHVSKGVHLQVGDWSVPYTVYGKACPKLDIGVVSQGVTRLIFRKFDSDKPELVGIIDNNKQLEFRDIHRDLYNSALEANEEIAKLDVTTLLKNGADITATFEEGRQAVHAAAKAGNMGIVLLLVAKGADIDAPDEGGYAPLHIAAELGYENFIEELISYGADVNRTSYLNWTALHVAAERDHTSVIKSLLQTEGIDVNARAAGGFTPLHIAVSLNNKDAIDILIADERTDINAQSEKHVTPLHLMVLGGHEEMVELFLSNSNIDVNLGSQGDLTALHLATAAGNVGIVKQLIEHDETDVNAISEDGWTALHLAVSSEKGTVTRMLLNSTEIEVNVEGKDNLTPLHLACFTGQNDIISELMDRNAEIEATENNGYTPLYFGVKGGHLDTVILLVEKGADLNVKNEKGETPLTLAISCKHSDIIMYLIHKELVEYDVHNRYNNTLLHYAAYEGCLEIVKYLIDANQTDLNVQNNLGETLLHVAASGNKLDVIKYLIDSKGMDFNAKNFIGNTPLHNAARKGHLEVVKYLIDDKKMDVNVKNIYGATPLHYAASHNKLEIFNYLMGIDDVDFNAKNWNGETPLDLVNPELYQVESTQNYLKSKGARRIRRNAVTNIKAAANSGKEKIKVKSDSESEVKKENNIKNTKRVKGSYTDILNAELKKNALISENSFKNYGSRTTPRIENHNDAREYSMQSTTYETTSHENVFFIKWLFYVFGRRSFVKRMNEAEDYRILHEDNHKDGGSSGNAFRIEKKLSEAIVRYGY